MKRINPVFSSDNYRRSNPIRIIKQFFSDVKCCFQRIRNGYCDYDLWSIDYWFLTQMPRMLEDFKRKTMGYPQEFENLNEWYKVLDQMIFLFREADEDTCTQTNPYSEKMSAVYDEFQKKYGLFGEKLMTDAEKERRDKTGYTRIYHPSDLPKYKDIYDKYSDEQQRLDAYRRDCAEKALSLFCKYFHNLWW